MVSEKKILYSLLDYGSYMLPWQPEFKSNQPKNIMQPYPLPDYVLHEI